MSVCRLTPTPSPTTDTLLGSVDAVTRSGVYVWRVSIRLCGAQSDAFGVHSADDVAEASSFAASRIGSAVRGRGHESSTPVCSAVDVEFFSACRRRYRRRRRAARRRVARCAFGDEMD